ncbi:type 2 isopentenyl-diphosphate Delta-isomerase, partial [Leucobacter sp. OLES1]
LEAIGPDGTGGGAERLIALVEDWKTRTRAVYALLGATTRDELLATDLVLRGRLREFCTDRGVDLRGLASRSEAPRA